MGVFLRGVRARTRGCGAYMRLCAYVLKMFVVDVVFFAIVLYCCGHLLHLRNVMNLAQVSLFVAISWIGLAFTLIRFLDGPK